MSEKPLPTAGQTVGPFFGYALPYEGGPELVPPHHPRAVLLTGTVYDGAGEPIPDAVVELWQPDENGDIPSTRGSLHRDGHSFTGFGRSATNRAADPLLSCLPAGRRTTLIACREPDGSLRHDFHLQGEDETVFLDFG